ncbi:hypothetical protein [Pseudomonas caricapapayae]|uniref:hypothetical protein n=1 Tax=Pseudomonas caricapapayae TaxID=46678 RepID=UPI000EFE06DE|nr:hypothetical protein [Pseudomonas caricapapayae]
MEVSAPEENPNVQQDLSVPAKKATSLPLAIFLTLVSFVVVFMGNIKRDFSASPIMDIVREPVLFQDYISKAIGGSILIPAIHVGIASIFKSKRNSSTRRRIFIGWAIVLVIAEILKYYTKH